MIPDSVVLHAYKGNYFTGLAIELLTSAGIEVELRYVGAGVHPDGTGPFGITAVPAVETPCGDIIAGYDAIRAWVAGIVPAPPTEAPPL